MEQEFRFGLNLGPMANFPIEKKKAKKHLELCLAPLDTPRHGTSL